jgi:DNA-binding NtrC family response regulator
MDRAGHGDGTSLARLGKRGGAVFPISDPRPITLIGRSNAMRELERDVSFAARCDAKVLITGETGVGKEVVARLVHERSRRHRAGLVTLNCGGVPDTLLESELFGHVRGSFTGAYRDRPGLLASAPNGTLFLDEIGEMSTRMQALLLRFLESGEIQRVGSDRVHIRSDVRLIAATNRNLEAEIESGAFRCDLYFRLNVIRLSVPPLRERAEDIPLLVNHFLERSAAAHALPLPPISPATLAALCRYEWPGNVRELRNVMERLVLMAEGRPVLPVDLPINPAPEAAVRAERRSGRARHEDRAAELVSQMENGESFWTAVHPRFMARDLTRTDLRDVIRKGLGATHGNYRALLKRFNMPTQDYKRFLRFLRAHDCHLSFQPFRVARFQRDERAAPNERALRSA